MAFVLALRLGALLLVSVATLGEAVDLEVYSRGARDERPTILTPSDRSDLIAFLEALTSDPAR